MAVMSLLQKLKLKLFRWQSDGLNPITLGQRRVFILPTRGGFLFAITLFAMLIAAINYNLALGHALVFLLTGIGLTGMIHTFRNLYGLHITPGKSSPVFAGDTALFYLHLKNTQFTARPALRFTTETAGPVETHLAPKSHTEVAIPVPSTRRGWLELPRIRLSTIYPLGLYVAWSYLQPAMRCLVYPAPVLSPLPSMSQTEQIGLLHGRGGQEDFSGFRERQPADSPKHIAWKASAREADDRPLLLKQFAGGAEMELRLDWELTAEGTSVEARLSQLTGWVLAADSAQLKYSLRLPGKEIQAGTGPAHRDLCLETLTLYLL